MRTVLGVDLGLGTTGLALVKGGKVQRAEGFKAPGPQKACMEERMAMVCREVVAWASNVDLTVIEAPSYASQGNATVTIGGLHYVVRVELWRNSLSFATAAPMTIKKWATGNGVAGKEMMLAAAKPFYDTRDHNVADSIHLARWGEAMFDELVEEGDG